MTKKPTVLADLVQRSSPVNSEVTSEKKLLHPDARQLEALLEHVKSLTEQAKQFKSERKWKQKRRQAVRQ